MIPTSEQQAIIDAALNTNDNLMIQADAGTAKTTTLELIAKAKPWPNAVALAFNVKIKQELERRLPGMAVMTLNGLGHRAWAKAISPKLVLDDRKLGKLITATSKELKITLEDSGWDDTRRIVTAAMQAGLVPSSMSRPSLVPDNPESWSEIAATLWIDTSDKLIAFCRKVLVCHIQQAQAGLISFDDQIYMSTLFGGVFPRFDLVLGDEVQDWSLLNIIQIKRCAANRIIAAGDQKQSIYRFRGAAADSMDRLRELRPNWIDLPLHTTFRCPQIIVERQQGHAPGFTAHDSVKPGSVTTLNSEGWSWSSVPNSVPMAVLCRNNGPLIGLGMKLIRQGIGCQMLGRDLGKGLVVLSKKLFPLDTTPTETCVEAIEQWREQQSAVATAAGHEGKLASINDRAECLLAVFESGSASDAGQLRSALNDLFSRQNMRVTLSTIHKAKGLEWPLVLHLDPWRVPSKHAKRRAKMGDFGELKQEKNLLYVCETRTKETLILANLADFN